MAIKTLHIYIHICTYACMCICVKTFCTKDWYPTHWYPHLLIFKIHISWRYMYIYKTEHTDLSYYKGSIIAMIFLICPSWYFRYFQVLFCFVCSYKNVLIRNSCKSWQVYSEGTFPTINFLGQNMFIKKKIERI